LEEVLQPLVGSVGLQVAFQDREAEVAGTDA